MLTYRLGFGPPSRLVRVSVVVGVTVMSGVQLVGWAAFAPPGQAPWASLLGGVLFGLPFGVLIGLLEHRRLGALRSALQDRMPNREAVRAANRGPVPVDPDTRGVARALIEYALAERGRQRLGQVLTASIAAVSGTLFALDGSAWGLVLVVLGAATVAWDRLRTARLQRRRALLADDPAGRADGVRR
ncbi:hypothetical protein [Klenkia brasiliensis]|uniref:Uncharacterized protein n=1 Tax=Klenkia brasiliensis TaxID=333142 RepID=A0A1G7LGR0_9ACTN|nr:hypothetical protein [Klenkia brasiliensis]SDF48149.1 hypothetical protein SAMN05660324_0242 [Klenkia brasiliensis]